MTPKYPAEKMTLSDFLEIPLCDLQMALRNEKKAAKAAAAKKKCQAGTGMPRK
jgi:hypothetical protein